MTTKYYLQLGELGYEGIYDIEISTEFGEHCKKDDIIWFDEDSVYDKKLPFLNIDWEDTKYERLGDTWIVILSRNIMFHTDGYVQVYLVCDNIHDGTNCKDKYNHLFNY